MINHNQIDLFISPRFLLFSASICIDCVRLCNREQPVNALTIRLVSEHGGPIPASNGISLQTEAISKLDSAGTVMALTSYEPELSCTKPVLQWIRQQYHNGARMVCIETAAYIFAQANLLELETKKKQIDQHGNWQHIMRRPLHIVSYLENISHWNDCTVTMSRYIQVLVQ